MDRKKWRFTWCALLSLLVGAAFGSYSIVDGPYFELDGAALLGSSTSTVDIFGTHTFDGSAKCTDPCLGSTYPYASVTVNIGLKNGSCSVSDPVVTNYSGGRGTSAGVPYIWAQAISKDKEFPAGVTKYEESTCDNRVYVGGGGNFYCA
jgi:hypothetical protein